MELAEHPLHSGYPTEGTEWGSTWVMTDTGEYLASVELGLHTNY
jgi:hypothetical protein